MKPAGGGGLSISVCSDANSWINPFIPFLLLHWLVLGHEVCWTHEADQLHHGGICFFLSYSKIVSKDVLTKHRNNLVVHASDLPKGRGMSPLTWQILEGRKEIAVTLLEAGEQVDSGMIYDQQRLGFEGHELIDEMRFELGKLTRDMCTHFIMQYPKKLEEGKAQKGEASYYRRRRPADSKVDMNKPLCEQFELLRVVDNQRYPAWFKHRGVKYKLTVEKTEYEQI